MLRIDVEIVFTGQTKLDIPKQLQEVPFKIIVNGEVYEKNWHFAIIGNRIELIPPTEPFTVADSVFFTDY